VYHMLCDCGTTKGNGAFKVFRFILCDIFHEISLSF
jgi:hypothetical protein